MSSILLNNTASFFSALCWIKDIKKGEESKVSRNDKMITSSRLDQGSGR